MVSNFFVVVNMKWDGEDIIQVREIAYSENMRYSMWDSTHSGNLHYMKKNARKYQF